MLKYLEGITHYSWKMNEDRVKLFEEKISKLDWNVMLFLHLIILGLGFCITYFLSSNLPSDVKNVQLLAMIIFIPSIIIYSFGGYYFTKIFFNTNLTVFQFYKMLLYIQLPIIIMSIIYDIINLISINNSSIYIIVIFLMIVFIYFGLQSLNTSLYIFRKEFNTSDWSLVGVVFLWAIISSIINFLLAFPLALLFTF